MLTCILGCIAHGAPRPVIRSDKALLDAISAMKKGAPFLKFPFSQVSASFFFGKILILKKYFTRERLQYASNSARGAVSAKWSLHEELG
jgi:hypothetical protein